MDFSKICRTCIRACNDFDLVPFFTSQDSHEHKSILSCAIYFYTGVQVKINDGLPQNMCRACRSQLRKILKFRKQCKQVEIQLLKIKTELESENSINFTHDHNFTQITEEDSVFNKQLTTTNKSDVEKCSNIKEIKTEYFIKDELLNFDIEEDQPLKYLVKSNTERKTDTDELNTENTSNTEFFNEEIILCRNPVKTEKTVSRNGNNIKSLTYSQKNVDCMQNTPKLKLKIPKSNITQDKTIDIPYIITETVSKKTMRVVCKLCQKELSIRSIDSHMMRRHPGADERKAKCELCDKYVMREKMNRHRIMMHGSIGVRCGYCKSEFNNKEALVDHVATCTAKTKRRKVNDSGRALAECDVCKMTMQKASLNKHKAVKHAGLRPVCEHCGKSFGNKFRLNEHYRAKHGYEKFKCSDCDFRSAGIMSMRNHERRHRGEKPYVCETCGAKFHAAYLLMQHKHSHNTEKLVKCDLCPASFKANNNLHMHKLTCHSKSYYSCTLCARSYKCRYYAVKHVRLAHRGCEAPDVIKVTSS